MYKVSEKRPLLSSRASCNIAEQSSFRSEGTSSIGTSSLIRETVQVISAKLRIYVASSHPIKYAISNTSFVLSIVVDIFRLLNVEVSCIRVCIRLLAAKTVHI